MRILAVDVGTGTQDILLFDSDKQELENCVKMVMPSPTLVVADAIRQATREGRDVLLDGVTMGGGPCHWAAMDHLKAGRRVYATPAAARTFDDDLEAVSQMGITLVETDEAAALRQVERLELRDFWLDPILDTLERFGVGRHLDAAAVAVFDHGAAPPGYSDRIFRFEYLAQRVTAANDLAAFAYLRDEVPERLTRLQAVVESFRLSLPILVMDTAPAAVLGALEDPAAHGPFGRGIVANLGNFHTLAFRFQGGRITGIFEHHTGELTAEELETYLVKLHRGVLTNEEVYEDMGHGALVLGEQDSEVPENGPPAGFVAITGPRRGLLRGSRLDPYLAVPHGDMMLAGCFGLLRAFAARDARVADAVETVMGPPPHRGSGAVG